MTDRELLEPFFRDGATHMCPPTKGWWTARWKNLERRGLIKMANEPDEDMVRVELTDAGKALFTDREDDRGETISEQDMTNSSEEHIAELIEALQPAVRRAGALRAFGIRLVGDQKTHAILKSMYERGNSAAGEVLANLFPTGHEEVTRDSSVSKQSH